MLSSSRCQVQFRLLHRTKMKLHKSEEGHVLVLVVATCRSPSDQKAPLSSRIGGIRIRFILPPKLIVHGQLGTARKLRIPIRICAKLGLRSVTHIPGVSKVKVNLWTVMEKNIIAITRCWTFGTVTLSAPATSYEWRWVNNQKKIRSTCARNMDVLLVQNLENPDLSRISARCRRNARPIQVVPLILCRLIRLEMSCTFQMQWKVWRSHGQEHVPKIWHQTAIWPQCPKKSFHPGHLCQPHTHLWRGDTRSGVDQSIQLVAATPWFLATIIIITTGSHGAVASRRSHDSPLLQANYCTARSANSGGFYRSDNDSVIARALGKWCSSRDDFVGISTLHWSWIMNQWIMVWFFPQSARFMNPLDPCCREDLSKISDSFWACRACQDIYIYIILEWSSGSNTDWQVVSIV